MNKVIKKYLLIGTVGIVLLAIIGVGYLLVKKPSTNQTQNQIATSTQIPNSTEEPEYPIDEVNDGVYINYKYGFKFEYPTDIFVYYTPTTPKESRIKALFADNKRGHPGNINMSVFTSNSNDELEFYSKYNDLSLNSFEYSDEYLSTIDEKIWPFNNRVKIKEIEIQKIEGYILYSKYIGHKRETEPSHGHSVRLLKDGVVISVNISSRAGEDFIDNLETKRLEILNNIINSFRFFTP